MRTFGKILGALIIIPIVLWILFLTISVIIPVFLSLILVALSIAPFVFLSLILVAFIFVPIAAIFRWFKEEKIFDKEENEDHVFKTLEEKKDENE